MEIHRTNSSILQKRNKLASYIANTKNCKIDKFFALQKTILIEFSDRVFPEHYKITFSNPTITYAKSIRLQTETILTNQMCIQIEDTQCPVLTAHLEQLSIHRNDKLK